MINQVVVDGFKRFERQAFDLKKLTILAGRNGAGKTSLIHSLLLLREATLRNDGVARLNGPFGIELGWFEDLVNINRFSSRPEFIVEIKTDTGDAEWTFQKGDTDLYARVVIPEISPPALASPEARSFQYISAERNGPRLTQRSSALPAMMLEVGPTGAHAAQVIERLITFRVSEKRLAGDSKRGPSLLKAQTEFWLTDIVRPTLIDTSELVGTDIIALRFKSPEGDWVRPTNMGFGVSYTLPVILAALTATENGLLIVENPEAHLHPAGQSEMGRFLAQMAASGLQVILETHSDHVLNGIRLAIADVDLPLRADDAIVHYFPDGDEEVQALEFTPSGGLLDWPAGFFDQFRIDVVRLTRAQRPVR